MGDIESLSGQPKPFVVDDRILRGWKDGTGKMTGECGKKGMWMDSERRRKREKRVEGSACETLTKYLAGQKCRVFNEWNLRGFRFSTGKRSNIS
jgi:hypothetical protein